jgi:hypothetical protein
MTHREKSAPGVRPRTRRCEQRPKRRRGIVKEITVKVKSQLWYYVCILALITIVIWLGIASWAEEDNHRHLPEVRTRDFLATTTVVGELACPLGKELRIKGTWIELADKPDRGLWFSVTYVNNRKLDRPIQFGESVVRPVDTMTKKPPYSAGDVWELRGFESGAFTGLPREYYTDKKYKELALPQGGAFAFVNTFEYFEIVQRGRAR